MPVYFRPELNYADYLYFYGNYRNQCQNVKGTFQEDPPQKNP